MLPRGVLCGLRANKGFPVAASRHLLNGVAGILLRLSQSYWGISCLLLIQRRDFAWSFQCFHPRSEGIDGSHLPV
jgi:hypothetical protein